MAYYKYIEDGYILAIGTGGMGEEITEEEYNNIMSVIRSKPAGTDTTDYRLKEDLTWEEYETEPPDPDPDIEDSEAFGIIFGGEP